MDGYPDVAAGLSMVSAVRSIFGRTTSNYVLTYGLLVLHYNPT